MPVELQIIISGSRVRIPLVRALRGRTVAQSGRAGRFAKPLSPDLLFVRSSAGRAPEVNREAVGSSPTGQAKQNKQEECLRDYMVRPFGRAGSNPAPVRRAVSQPIVLLTGNERKPPANAEGTTWHQRDRSSGFNSPPCRRPDGKRIRPFGCGAGLPPVSSPLVAGAEQNVTIRL